MSLWWHGRNVRKVRRQRLDDDDRGSRGVFALEAKKRSTPGHPQLRQRYDDLVVLLLGVCVRGLEWVKVNKHTACQLIALLTIPRMRHDPSPAHTPGPCARRGAAVCVCLSGFCFFLLVSSVVL